MLNLVCHLSGIATTTAAWVDAVERHQRPDPRHPQDAARAAGAAEVRGAGGRRRQPPDGSGRRGADQGQPRRGGGFGGRRAARRPRGGAGSAVRGRGRLAGTTRRGVGRERGTRAAGQLPGVADADRGAASRRPRSRTRNSSRPADCRWRPRPSMPVRASTIWRSARSPTRCGYSISGWIFNRVGQGFRRATLRPLRRRRRVQHRSPPGPARRCRRTRVHFRQTQGCRTPRPCRQPAVADQSEREGDGGRVVEDGFESSEPGAGIERTADETCRATAAGRIAPR